MSLCDQQHGTSMAAKTYYKLNLPTLSTTVVTNKTSTLPIAVAIFP